jgi:uncharacterized protein YvpB
MKTKTKQEQKIEMLASNIVETMFKDFQKPSFQGPTFTWGKFPEMMKDLAKGYTPATFHNVSGEKLTAIEEAVSELAFKLAQEKVDKEIFKKVLPKP